MTEAEEITQKKRAVQRLYEEVWNRGDLAVADELFAGDFEHLGPAVPGHLSGLEGYKEFVTMFRNAFPDTQIDIVESIGEGDTVVVRWLGHGTHEGELMGIDPTDERVATPGVSLVHFDDGRIHQIWDIYDTYDLLAQLGATDPLTG